MKEKLRNDLWEYDDIIEALALLKKEEEKLVELFIISLFLNRAYLFQNKRENDCTYFA